MAEMRGVEVFDGEIKIGNVVRQATAHNKEGFWLQFVPVGDDGWKKGMGAEEDAKWIASLFACSICKGCASVDYMEPIKARLLEKHICFNCDFWQQQIAEDTTKRKDTCVIVGGKHYVMGENNSGSRWNGFGGHVWNIEFFDGRKAFCNNLWAQGEIPERWRGDLKDNARFIHQSKAVAA